MKKVFFAVAAAAVALFSFTGCDETVTKDVTISFTANGAYSSSTSSLYTGDTTDNGLTRWDLQDIYFAALKEIDGATQLNNNSVCLKAQTSEEKVKEIVLAVGEKADKAVKAKFGDPVIVNPHYSNLSITLYHNWSSTSTPVVTYKYE